MLRSLSLTGFILMQMSIALTLHVLAVIIWIGGMFFAHMALRPASIEILEPPLRLPLWSAVFKRFFFWVWISIILLLVTGFWLFFMFPKPPLFIHLMTGIGVVMMLIFGHIYFAPYRRLKKFIATESWKEAGEALGEIRSRVGINLILGLLTTVIAIAGKYFL